MQLLYSTASAKWAVEEQEIRELIEKTIIIIIIIILYSCKFLTPM